MGGQGIMGGTLGIAGQAVPQPNYGQQPMGADLGVSTADMGFGQAPINPNFGSITAQVKPNVPQGLVFDEAKGWVQPNQATNTMPSPIDNFGGIASQAPNSFVNNAPQGVGQTTPTQNPYGANPFTNTTNPYVQAAQQTQFGNVQGAQAATAANRVNQQTPFGSLTYSQTGVDANGNPVWSASQSYAPEVANTLSQLSGQFGQNISGGFNPQLPSYGINPNEAYTDAIMRRLEPIQQRQQQQLETRLANQGIMRGSEAYNNAISDFNQKQNDQLTSAVVGGMQTGLAANQQAYGQALQNYNLPLTQLSSYRTATAPTYINPYTQAAVAGPDYTGAYTSSIAAEIEKQKADAAQQAALTGGLFQLGGSVLSNPTATSSLGGIINKGIGAVGDVFSGLF